VGFMLGPLVAGFTASSLGFRSAFAIAVVPTVVALILAVRSQETLRIPA